MMGIIKKIRKYIFRPDLIICRLGVVLKNLIIVYNSKVSRGRIIIGKNITLYQRTKITGKGMLSLGNNIVIGTLLGGYYYKGICELQPRYDNSKIILEDNIATNNNLLIIAADQVFIGDSTLIGEGVMIIDHDAHDIHPDKRRSNIGKVSPIYIGKNVWIGSRVIILSGTKIGNNSIVGAGSVVKGEFPNNVILAGNPARIIKEIVDEN